MVEVAAYYGGCRTVLPNQMKMNKITISAINENSFLSLFSMFFTLLENKNRGNNQNLFHVFCSLKFKWVVFKNSFLRIVDTQMDFFVF